ncbi:DUF4230 domain-containing protein [Tenacibaculum maritimum]|uniref:DUF4230 domain-containing protein n=1 Tax=Tenacibaculum maritimum TaxID=107401 RepID=UPI001E460BD2|nr:DUF4230 domain-containing protein [Tenacibaculum maritimum]MCD9584073.1 DUF4230 domain-containing protein [Tenacibaculum maritimum]MCD9610405.1 DUF4230 domain-containing protein [Tenacibaculum maritimum]MCD9620087.1 DUF4230 domain-containing protein [Tenacibaculum maritimum]MCD9626441.1 DUF4230 domain-containing protein [Tenacibaculum maritimum]MCD9629016.1 DUF4230 domain-containing protein [Tenacibaculum maritimum]
MQIVKYTTVFILGFLVAKFWYDKRDTDYQKEEIKVMLNGIKSMSKLVVAEGTFSEVLNYSDSKKYLYDFLSFDKKAIVTVEAKVEVGYDLSKLDVQIDSIGRKIVINKIPSEEIIVVPNVRYFDLQQSQFNSFTKEELNKINQNSIARIKETAKVSMLQADAKIRLFEELSKIYQLSSVFNWEVVDHTDSNLLHEFLIKD